MRDELWFLDTPEQLERLADALPDQLGDFVRSHLANVPHAEDGRHQIGGSWGELTPRVRAAAEDLGIDVLDDAPLRMRHPDPPDPVEEPS